MQMKLLVLHYKKIKGKIGSKKPVHPNDHVNYQYQMIPSLL